jgi:uncharacterized protein (TIGR02270 family)
VAVTFRQFNVGLYTEHLEEASFLYEQRLTYLQDPEVNWPSLRSWEERFEAHVDALVLGGDLALEVCRQRAAEGDIGEMHAALRVFCRHRQKKDAFAVLIALDPADDKAVRAASQALRWDAPREWVDELLQFGPRDRVHLTRVLAQVIGFRRFECETFLTSAVTMQPPLGLSDLAWALGRVGTVQSAPVLSVLLESEDERTCEAAAIALMRLGDERSVRRAMQHAHAHAWARRVLAIGGGAKAVGVLLDSIRAGTTDMAAVLALGLLGDLAAVSPLVDLLDDEDLSEPAAVALNTITGAGLYADVFIPELVDPDELSRDEREAFDRDGTVPLRGGRPFGNFERRPLLKKDSWRAWLEREKARFSREHRWRMGKPYGPAALVECLKADATPFAVRMFTYEELVVRYGLDVPFEVELPVRQQTRFLAKIEDWVTAQSGQFADGRWYFAGRIQG